MVNGLLTLTSLSILQSRFNILIQPFLVCLVLDVVFESGLDYSLIGDIYAQKDPSNILL